MGLDTTHNAWHGSYSSFNHWRAEITKLVGIENLHDMEGFGGEIKWTYWEHNDLYPLLSHSDCDGELTVEECRKTLKGLADIYDKIESEEARIKAVEFMNGCKLAIHENEPIEFH